MDVLKKVKASTLMETMVATVLIIIVFMLASGIMNTIFSATVQGAPQKVVEHTHKLEYQFARGAMQLPYFEEYDVWEIEILNEKNGTANEVILKVIEMDSGKLITRRVL